MKRKLLPLRGFQFYLTWSQDDKKDHDQSRKIKKEGPSLKKKKTDILSHLAYPWSSPFDE